MKKTKWFALALSAGLLAMAGCSDKDPVSSAPTATEDDASAAKLVVSGTKAAGTCEGPGCRPGFGGVSFEEVDALVESRLE
jgi:hypothetical protein